MWPPSSWPIGRRLRNVARSPTQTATTTGWISTTSLGPIPGKRAWSARLRSAQEGNPIPPRLAPSGSRVDRDRPYARTGNAATKPAIGPATPTSNRARRVVNGARIRMSAPNVPRRGGPGMKNGSEASIR